MSAHDAPAFDAIAFQLAAALDRYDQDVGAMVETWLDMELYRCVSDEVEHIRLLSASLPQLSVAWVELLIAHAELVHSLWRLRFNDDATDRVKLDEVRARHNDCVQSLRKRCLRLMSRSENA
jgi:hypothetical protein